MERCHSETSDSGFHFLLPIYSCINFSSWTTQYGKIWSGGCLLCSLCFFRARSPYYGRCPIPKRRITFPFNFNLEQTVWDDSIISFLPIDQKKHPCKVLDLLDPCSPSSTTYQTNRPAVSRSGLSIDGTWLWDFRLQKSFKYPAVNRFFSHDFRCGGSGCYWFHRQIGVCASGENSNVDIPSEFNLEPMTIVRASQMVANSKGIIRRSRSLVGMRDEWESIPTHCIS